MSDQLPTGSTINGSRGAKFGSRDPVRGWAGKRRAGELPPKSAPVPFPPLPSGKQLDMLPKQATPAMTLLTACRGRCPLTPDGLTARNIPQAGTPILHPARGRKCPTRLKGVFALTQGCPRQGPRGRIAKNLLTQRANSVKWILYHRYH